MTSSAIVAAHKRDGDVYGFGHCVECGEPWPCSTAMPHHLRSFQVKDVHKAGSELCEAAKEVLVYGADGPSRDRLNEAMMAWEAL